jgi:ABC-type amino acid transport substrate-binding protein
MAEGGGAPPPEAVRRGVTRALFAVTVIVVAVLAFAGGIGVGTVFFGGQAPPPRTTFIVAVQAPFPPFMDFNTSVDIGFEGFEVDIALLIADELNRTLIMRQYSSFSTLLLETGRNAVDMASASITITSARNGSMDFSDPYFRVDQGFLVKETSAFACTNSVCTPQDIADKTVAVQQATTSEEWINDNVRSLMADPDNQIRVFQQVPELISALQADAVDTVMIDSVTAKDFADGPDFKLAGIVATGEAYGFAVGNNDPQGLVPVINSVLATIRADGRYNALLTKWGLPPG